MYTGLGAEGKTDFERFFNVFTIALFAINIALLILFYAPISFLYTFQYFK